AAATWCAARSRALLRVKTPRTVDDRLREEYFRLYPDILRVARQIETEIRHHLLPFMLKLDKYEQIVVKARVKDCESAINSLRRRQELRTFIQSKASKYSLTMLKDLVGVRVLVFPRTKISPIDDCLRKHYPKWKSDPVAGLSKGDAPLAHKYFG